MTIQDPLMLAAGAALLLFGWALYRAALVMVGGVLLGAAGVLAGASIGPVTGATGDEVLAWQIGGGMIGAGIGILLLLCLHKAVFFAAGFAAALAAFLAVFGQGRAQGLEWAQNDVLFYFGAPAAGVLGGLLAAALDRYVITFASAMVGALLVMEGLGWPYGGLPALGLAPLGALWQLSVARPWKKRKRRRPRDGGDGG
jgi:hypothetical protein